MVKSGRTWAPAPQAWPCVVNSNDSWAPLWRSADRMRSIQLICGHMPDFPGGQLAQTGCVHAQQGMLLTINALTQRLQYPGPNEIDHQSAEARNVCPGHSRIDHRRAGAIRAVPRLTIVAPPLAISAPPNSPCAGTCRPIVLYGTCGRLAGSEPPDWPHGPSWEGDEADGHPGCQAAGPTASRATRQRADGQTVPGQAEGLGPTRQPRSG